MFFPVIGVQNIAAELTTQWELNDWNFDVDSTSFRCDRRRIDIETFAISHWVYSFILLSFLWKHRAPPLITSFYSSHFRPCSSLKCSCEITKTLLIWNRRVRSSRHDFFFNLVLNACWKRSCTVQLPHHICVPLMVRVRSSVPNRPCSPLVSLTLAKE